MKNILVPTDFSDCAKHALVAAVLWANRFGSKLFVLNSQNLPPYWDNLPAEEKSKWALANQGIANDSTLIEEIKANHPDIEMETLITSKPLPSAVSECIEKHGIDMIIMGSHGASGKSEYFIGSNAQKVIRTVHCPTLVIKQPLENIKLEHIVYASTFQEADLDAFLVFKNIVKHFIPEIHLVYVNKSMFDKPAAMQIEAMKPFEKACYPLTCHLHIYPDLSVDSGIRSFADKINADLISISYHERHPVKRMLIGSNVEAIINHADLPVLTIDFLP
ncbi:MAG: universal stress protein [Saprospiraceae bacterium]